MEWFSRFIISFCVLFSTYTDEVWESARYDTHTLFVFVDRVETVRIYWWMEFGSGELARYFTSRGEGTFNIIRGETLFNAVTYQLNVIQHWERSICGQKSLEACSPLEVQLAVWLRLELLGTVRSQNNAVLYRLFMSCFSLLWDKYWPSYLWTFENCTLTLELNHDAS